MRMSGRTVRVWGQDRAIDCLPDEAARRRRASVHRDRSRSWRAARDDAVESLSHRRGAFRHYHDESRRRNVTDAHA